MDYVTSRELSEKWGISQCQIILRAREGRIPGAKLYGKTWLFPEDAVKPIDGRTKAGRAAKERGAVKSTAGSTVTAKQKDSFRFPDFAFKDEALFDPPLSEDELALKTVEERFIACRFEEAAELLGTLPENLEDRYLRIYALYCGCMIDIALCKTGRFLRRYEKLWAELAEEFPYKEEMSELLREIEATLGSDDYYSRKFNLKPAYHYHESFLPLLCNLQAFCLTLSEGGACPTTCAACEINCRFLEKTDNRFNLQSMHIYLGCAYAIAGRTAERDHHFEKALALAEKYGMFYSLATQYYYMRKEFAPALKGHSTEFKEKLDRLSNNLHNQLVRFSDAMELNSFYAMLISNDYIYVIYAVQGLTNKEVAARSHLSTGAVGKKYGSIYAQLGVRSKAELAELYRNAMNTQSDRLSDWVYN